MALSLAYGRPFAGVPLEQTCTLYVAAEGQSGLMLRIEAWRTYYKMPPLSHSQMVLMTRPLALLKDAEVDEFIEMVALIETTNSIKFDFIGIDTLAQCTSGGDEQSAKDMGRATANMIKIRMELNTTVVFVHHTGKDPLKEMRGSSAIKGNTDGMLCCEREDKSMISTLISKRHKDVAQAPDIAFECHEVFIPRLQALGCEVCSSLVVDFANVPLPQQAADHDDKMTQHNALRHIIATSKRIKDSRVDTYTMLKDLISESKCNPRVGKWYNNQQYKDHLCQMLKLNDVVEVPHDAFGFGGGLLCRVLGGTSRRRANSDDMGVITVQDLHQTAGPRLLDLTDMDSTI